MTEAGKNSAQPNFTAFKIIQVNAITGRETAARHAAHP
jgi:hypothetical protein